MLPESSLRSELIEVQRPTSHRWLAWATLILSFFPYITIDIGANTSIPLCTTFALTAWVFSRHREIDGVVLLLLVLPMASNAVATIAFGSQFSPAGLLSWGAVVGAFVGGYIIVRDLQLTAATAIAWLVIGTSIFATLQLLAIKAGVIPFLDLYRAAGYASVDANSFAILQYIQRPFAQFPESSFMAGTLLLTLSTMVLITRMRGVKMGRIEWMALLLGGVAIVLSESGSAIVGLGLLAALIAFSSRRSLRNQLSTVFLFALATAAAIWIVDQRSGTVNFSWGDRLGSIFVSVRYWASDVGSLFLGVGRGGLTKAFQSSLVPTQDLAFTQQPLDIFSAVIRVPIEFGLFGGATALLILWAALFVRHRVGAGSRLISVMVLAIWFLVGGLTISYDSAVWIWALPGAYLALRKAPSA